MKRLIALLPLLVAAVCSGQYSQYTTYARAHSIGVGYAVQYQTALSANANDSLGNVPTRKQLGNVGTGCSGGVITPTGVPVGQLYATTAIQSSAETAGCATQGVVTVTSSGTGILAMDNGNNAGGTDSPTALTDTYGGTTYDSICTGNSYAAAHTVVLGVAMPGCTASSSATFAETTATGFGNSDVLFPSSYHPASLDGVLHAFRQVIFMVDDVTKLHDLEMDSNYNSTAGYYYGWGLHWNSTVQMFQYCPQACTGWKTFKGQDPNGINPDLTTFPLTSAHWYVVQWFYHRGDVSTCTPTSGSNCYFYDDLRVWDITAGGAPVVWALVDATTGNPAGGIPVDKSSWTRNLVTPQIQLDMTSGNASLNVHIDSDVLMFY